jgi:WD40 repeat protein
MFSRLFSRGDPPSRQASGGSLPRKTRGTRIYLPSPFLLGLVCVFVVLPLAWPETGPEASRAFELASFQLASGVTSTVFSSDGHRLAATCQDRPVVYWQRDQRSWSGHAVPIHHPNGARSLALAPGHPTLAIGNCDGSVLLWNLASGLAGANITSGTETVSALAYSPAGDLLALASADSRIRLVDASSGRVLHELSGHQGPISALVFVPDGRALISGGDDGAIVRWDVEQGRQTARVQAGTEVILALAESPGEELLASSALCGFEIRLWDPRTLEPRGSLVGGGSTSTCLAFTADGGPLLSGNDTGDVIVWDVARACPRATFRAHEGWVKSLSLGLHDQLLATGGNDSFVRVWDLAAVMRAR